MKFIGSFFQFAGRVIVSAKKGGLSILDLKKLDNLLTRTGKRNTIMARGILSALSAGGASKQDVADFGRLLQKAETRISQDKNPFTTEELERLNQIFQRAYLSTKVSKWFSNQIDELLAEEINEFIGGKSRVDLGVPSRKTVKFETEPEQYKAEKRKKIKL
ncbi:hypothetical protein KKF81_05260 [Candidatus Micrarchaeota archaeon]|nr:hypothetical protein [Candidatus Micrarchaeota archaeon]MBU1166335.1 hypothetical protein [Candidatus Micrarchaeota archaeon]MBU1886413.1 hypothetical protein [Candidatus Micrarchaeota archaeon]